MGYSTTAIATAAALMKYPWWQRPMIAPLLTETKNLKKHINVLQDFLRPVLQVSQQGVMLPKVLVLMRLRPVLD